MEYCPYCSVRLPKDNYKKCPFCKKSLDMQDLESVIEPGTTTEKDKQALRRIWLREHSSTFIPILTLITGFIVGAIIIYSYAQIQISGERADYENQISELKAVVAQKDSLASTQKGGLEAQLTKQTKIIELLEVQKSTLRSIITLTRRIARASTITPNSEQEVDYFIRNVNYHKSQYDDLLESLTNLGYKHANDFILGTIPQILNDE